MKKTSLVFLPVPAPGHLVSTVEFSKRLIARDARLSVTVLVIDTPFFQKAQTIPTPGISYVTLPQLDMPTELFEESEEYAISVYIASHRAYVKAAIAALQTGPTHVAGLFIDMFCTSMIDVANELGLPSYLFFCSPAGFLGFLLYLPVHFDCTSDARFDESGPDALIPCFQNPVPTRVLPGFGFNKLGYKAFMDHAKKFVEMKGIVINTFAELEPYALKSLIEQPQLRNVPGVYTVGPVVNLDSQIHKPCDAAERERIMGWLNKQPDSSVVFLCFGSEGSFSEEQIREISKGLSQSGKRFLWSLRKPSTEGLVDYTQVELRRILCDEFWRLLGEEERGVFCGWAPQVEILGHKGVGTFVSHCGWNSTLEALWFGKPIVTWPLYAEQQLNAFELVEFGIAVELTLDYRVNSSRLVEASEVERAVRCVMEEDNPVRYKVKEMAEVCRAAQREGGSSFSCVDRLISELVYVETKRGD